MWMRSPGFRANCREYQELMITRRLYRNGDSEYLINKTACRLKDVRNVLMDTRAGVQGAYRHRAGADRADPATPRHRIAVN